MKNGKFFKIIMFIIIMLFMIMNSNITFAKTKEQLQKEAQESFEYYYENDYKGFVNSGTYKDLKKKKANKNKNAAQIYVDYCLSTGDQKLKNFLNVFADDNFSMKGLSQKEYSDCVDLMNAISDNAGPIQEKLGYSGSIDYANKFDKSSDKITNDTKYNNLTGQQKNKLNGGKKQADASATISKGEGKTASGDGSRDDTIYNSPDIIAKNSSSASLDDMINDADKFVLKGEDDKIKEGELAKFSGMIYNIVLQVGIAIAVIVGIVLGIQFMLSGIDGRADVKKALKIYVIGCVLIFGAFGIWKIVVEILKQI